MSQTPGLWLIAGLCVSGPALADLALVQEKQCMQCHAVSQDLIGPSFKRIAYRWKGNPAAEKMRCMHTRADAERCCRGPKLLLKQHGEDGRPVPANSCFCIALPGPQPSRYQTPMPEANAAQIAILMDSGLSWTPN